MAPLCENDITAPPGSSPPESCRRICRSQGENPRDLFQRRWGGKKIVDSGLGATGAIKAEASCSSQTPAADSRSGPLRRGAAWGQLSASLPVGQKNTSLSLPRATPLRGCLAPVAILWFVIQRVRAEARARERGLCVSGTCSEQWCMLCQSHFALFKKIKQKQSGIYLLFIWARPQTHC